MHQKTEKGWLGAIGLIVSGIYYCKGYIMELGNWYTKHIQNPLKLWIGP